MVALTYDSILITQDSAAPAALLWTARSSRIEVLYHTVVQYARYQMDYMDIWLLMEVNFQRASVAKKTRLLKAY